jgi:hypothetical protein
MGLLSLVLCRNLVDLLRSHFTEANKQSRFFIRLWRASLLFGFVDQQEVKENATVGGLELFLFTERKQGVLPSL